MYQDFWYPSCGAGTIHGCRWEPEGQPRAVVQILHGIADFAARYDEFAAYLTTLGYLVVAEDHMGHGESINGEGIQGYFHGGWDAAVEDSCRLMRDIQKEFPNVPFVLFGHSMGSFMARTILCKYPDAGISAAVICGTTWAPAAPMPLMIKLCEGVCKKDGETNPSPKLQNAVFGSYNRKIAHPRTEFDWISRDREKVKFYVEHPLCGFTATAGLLRDMMKGMHYMQNKENLSRMNKDIPVFFVAGGDDPVGGYGSGVRKAAEGFRKYGMKDVSLRIYPLCRHEILNEINRQEIFEDIGEWIEKKLFK